MRKEGCKVGFSLNRRGLSAIVTTLIIILLSLVVIGVLWVVVKGVVQTNAEKIQLGQYTLNMKIESAQVGADNTSVFVTLKRSAGAGNFSSMKFVFSDGHNSETVIEDSPIHELEEKNYEFNLSKIDPNNIIEITVSPVFTLSSGKESTGNPVDTYEVADKGLSLGTGAVVEEVNNFEKYGAVGMGTADYKISSSADSIVNIKEVIIDPLDVHVGDIQNFTVIVYSPYNITSVNSVTQLDNDVLNLPLEKVSETPDQAIFSASWEVYDTHVKTYRTLFTAEDTEGNTDSVNMTWTDPCSGITQGANSILSVSCSVGASSTDGIDTGNLTIASGVTLTLNTGSTFVWTPGYSLNITGSIALSGGALQKGYLFQTDSDGDGYGAGTGTYAYSASSTWASHVRAKDSSGTDCNDGSASYYQYISGYTDADGDSYTVGGIQPVCSGASLPSGYSASSSGTDCNDASAAAWVNKYYDSDGDAWCNSASTYCVGNDAGYRSSCTSYSDCSTGDATKYQYLIGYADADSDSFASSSGGSICSGASLPAGYSSSAGTDCNDGNGNIHQTASVATDSDQDGYSTSTASSQCVGYSATINGRTYYVDSAGSYTRIGSTSLLGTSDCNDASGAYYQNLAGYVDADGDGYGTGTSSNVCSGASLPSGYSATGGDCLDSGTGASYVYQSVASLATDGDQDRYYTGTATTRCVGGQSSYWYLDTSGGYTYISSSSALGSSDCYDNNGYAHPGQTSYFSVSINGGGDYDYNCDGSQSKQYTLTGGSCGTALYDCGSGCTSFFSCGPDPACAYSGGSTGWTGASPACGSSGSYGSNNFGCSTLTQACR